MLHAARKSTAIRRESDFSERFALVRAALHVELAVVENDVGLVRFEHVRGQLAPLVNGCLSSRVHGHAAYCERAAAVRAVAEGRPLARIAMAKLDRIVWDAQGIRRYLRERGVVTLAV